MSSEYHPALDDPNAFVFYRYVPSQAAAIIFVLAFLTTTVLHCLQCIRSRTWYLVPLITGGFCKFIRRVPSNHPLSVRVTHNVTGEVVGYVGRAMSAKDQWALTPYIIQSMLLLIAPAFFAASVYMILGRIILATDGEKHSVVRKLWLTKIFVTGDVISLLAQSAGGGIMSSGSLSTMHTGEKIVVFGLFVQLIFFGFFMYASIMFYIHIGKAPTSKSLDPDVPWRRHLWILMVVSLSIFARSIFRVIEYCSGNDGYLLKHEIFLYLFDSCLMLLVMVLFNACHPSEVTGTLVEVRQDNYEMYLRQSSVSQV